MEIIVAFLCGAIVPFAVQTWAFYEQEKKEKVKLRAFLSILNEDLKEYYEKLFIGNAQYYCADPFNLLANFKGFNTANKHAMWSELMKFEIFQRNPQIFGKVNSVTHKIETLNREVLAFVPITQNITSSSKPAYVWKHIMDEIRNLYGESNSYSNTTIGSFFAKEIQRLG